MIITLMVVDEFRGHQLIEAARSCDSAKIKKHITAETINFQHPLTMESALVSLLSLYRYFLTKLNYFFIP